jgi:hypothetical protein
MYVLGGEKTCGVGMEKATDVFLGCDVGSESRMGAFPLHKLKLVSGVRTFVKNLNLLFQDR